eukprot:SAG31_NODE_598_length_13651_cov_10.681818_13_plen_494_part_00
MLVDLYFCSTAQPQEPVVRWRPNSLRLMYSPKRVFGSDSFLFVHSPAVLTYGDGIEHIFACHSERPKQFDDIIFYAQTEEGQEVTAIEPLYKGTRYESRDKYGVDWGDWEYYWNACEPAVLNRKLPYNNQSFDQLMLHTSMPMESFICIEEIKSIGPTEHCPDSSENNDIGAVFLAGVNSTNQRRVQPLQRKFMTFNRTANKPEPRPFEYGIGQPSIATFDNDTYVFFTYGDSEGIHTRWRVRFARLAFDDTDSPVLQLQRTMSMKGITDIFGNQVNICSNVDVIYDSFRDMIYMLTDLYPFPLGSRVSGALQLVAISRRGLLDTSDSWRQLGVIYEDENYLDQIAREYGVTLTETQRRMHNVYYTNLKRHHNPSFVKSGQGTLLDQHRLRIYFTSADDTSAQLCLDGHGSVCAEYSYQLHAIGLFLDEEKQSTGITEHAELSQCRLLPMSCPGFFLMIAHAVAIAILCCCYCTRHRLKKRYMVARLIFRFFR